MERNAVEFIGERGFVAHCLGAGEAFVNGLADGLGQGLAGDTGKLFRQTVSFRNP